MEKQTIKLSIEINAPKDKVWDVLLQDATYRSWTSVFSPGSYAQTDWKQGSKVLFKSSDGSGLVSKVLVHKPAEIISIEHLGLLKDGAEYYDEEEVKKWQGLKETYHVAAKDGKTELTIEQDITKEHAGWFATTWQKALQKVKELAEEKELKMVEVFRTDVADPQQAKRLVSRIHQAFSAYRANFDLDDCDRILREVSLDEPVQPALVIGLLKHAGFSAEVLPDSCNEVLNPEHERRPAR